MSEVCCGCHKDESLYCDQCCDCERPDIVSLRQELSLAKAKLEKMTEDRDRWADSACRLEASSNAWKLRAEKENENAVINGKEFYQMKLKCEKLSDCVEAWLKLTKPQNA